MIILTIPVFFPVFQTLDFGMSPEDAALWFGVLVLIVVEVGLITPPVGMKFVINKLAKDVPLSESFRGVLPFVASDLIRVVIPDRLSSHHAVCGSFAILTKPETFMLQIDHFTLGASDLLQGRTDFQKLTGLTLPMGGKHPHMSTHNCLTSVGHRQFF